MKLKSIEKKIILVFGRKNKLSKLLIRNSMQTVEGCVKLRKWTKLEQS